MPVSSALQFKTEGCLLAIIDKFINVTALAILSLEHAPQRAVNLALLTLLQLYLFCCFISCHRFKILFAFHKIPVFRPKITASTGSHEGSHKKDSHQKLLACHGLLSHSHAPILSHSPLLPAGFIRWCHDRDSALRNLMPAQQEDFGYTLLLNGKSISWQEFF
ncbi:hypothetical protein HYR99_21875 [Candidatus Poribacteria bacterium]|nr:hypothetical protein [Candidatus Poribacteria bacterium]